MLSDLLFLRFSFLFDFLQEAANLVQDLENNILQKLVSHAENEFLFPNFQDYSSFLGYLFQKENRVAQFCNAQEFSRLVIKALELKIGETILDPSCGSGGFLIEAHSHLKTQCRTAQERRIVAKQSIFGDEENNAYLNLAKINCFFNGFKLSQTKLSEFDVVIGNPPHTNQNVKPIEILYEIKDRFRYLKEGGRAAFFFPIKSFTPTLKEFCTVATNIFQQQKQTVWFSQENHEFLLLVLEKKSARDVQDKYSEATEAKLKQEGLVQNRYTTHYHIEKTYFQEERFELICSQRRGIEFQHWLEKVLTKYDPSFKPIKPDGRNGDWKCDGFTSSNGTVYQIYAPDKLSSARTKKKIAADFEGAKEKWKENLKRWVFIWSSSDNLPPGIVKCLEDLKRENLSIEIKDWGRSQLWKEVFVGKLSGVYRTCHANVSGDTKEEVRCVPYSLNF